jgi:hypothetical protein
MNKPSKLLLTNAPRALALEVKMAKVRVKQLKERIKQSKRDEARAKVELLGAESVLAKLLARVA